VVEKEDAEALTKERDRKIQTRERAPHIGSILDLPEAESFIRHILEKWLDSKRPATT